MKQLKVRRLFSIRVSPDKIRNVQPGTYDVPGQLDNGTAIAIIRQRAGSWIPSEDLPEKKAPETKVVEPVEEKVVEQPEQAPAKPAKKKSKK